MKKIIMLLIATILAIGTVQARTFVLIAGVSNYGGRTNNLHQSTKDAKQFKALMETQTKDITILTSSNVTYSNLFEKLRAICNRAQKGDRIIFYFSGHGAPGVFCGYDKNIPYEDLVAALSSSQASEKICFIDACFAGSASSATVSKNESWVKRATGRKDIALMVSSRPEETSKESSLVGGGFFTQSLVNGLRGKADSNRDRQITLMEAFKYVHADIVRRTKDIDSKQHPQLIAPANMHDIVITKWN